MPESESGPCLEDLQTRHREAQDALHHAENLVAEARRRISSLTGLSGEPTGLREIPVSRRTASSSPQLVGQVDRYSRRLLVISGQLKEIGQTELAEELQEMAVIAHEGDRLLTVVEASAWLNCGRRTVDQMVADRRIPAHLIGGRYRFDKLEVLRETKLK